jgi:hypothetical protein
MLASLFWADIERHPPGTGTLRLPPEVAHGWKQRIRVLPDGSPRLNFHNVLLAVRALYLDLLQWSLEDPARWAQWAAPCPITEADVRGYIKESRRRRARMAERTRTLAPVLPRLVTAAEQQLDRAARLADAARAAPPGGEFTIDGTRYLRTSAPGRGLDPRPGCSRAAPTSPASGSTPRPPRTRRSGPGRSLRCCAAAGSGSRNCWN